MKELFLMTSHQVSKLLPQIPLFSPKATGDLENSNGSYNSVAVLQGIYSSTSKSFYIILNQFCFS